MDLGLCSTRSFPLFGKFSHMNTCPWNNSSESGKRAQQYMDEGTSFMDALPQSCSWDRAGNRRYVNSDGVSSWSDFNCLNQQLRTENTDTGQVTEYSYCPNGNKVREVSADTVRYFDYSVDNRPTQVRAGADANSLTTINANTFRGDGQRISRYEDGQHVYYTYLDGTVLSTADCSGSLVNFHIKDPAGSLISQLHYRNAGSPSTLATIDIRQSASNVLDHA